MAVVREITTKAGVRVIIRDELMESDQVKAWEKARTAASSVYLAKQRRK